MKTCTNEGCQYPVFSKGKCKYHTPKAPIISKMKAKKEKVKLVPLPKLMKKTEKIVNAYVRERDKGQPCISCGSLNANQAGHYFPVGMFSGLRFNLDNIHLQCPACNLYRHGNQAMYRIGLCKRIGVLAVEELEREAIDTPIKKWSRSELNEIMEKYSV